MRIADDEAEARRIALNELSYTIVGCAIEVHRAISGLGLLESIYEEALCLEMLSRGLFVERQKECTVFYKGQSLATRLRLDVVVNQAVIVECKATLDHNKAFESQLFTYLKVTNLKLGLLLNCGATIMRNGVRRVVNDF